MSKVLPEKEDYLSPQKEKILIQVNKILNIEALDSHSKNSLSTNNSKIIPSAFQNQIQLITKSDIKLDDLRHNIFTRNEMGRLVWTVMHLYSAYFPEKPTENQRQESFTLIRLL